MQYCNPQFIKYQVFRVFYVDQKFKGSGVIILIDFNCVLCYTIKKVNGT